MFYVSEVAISQPEKTKVLPINLVEVPTIHRIAVAMSAESRWRYERGPVL